MTSSTALRAPADWTRVARVRVAVDQEYRYDYPAPVTDLRQRLVLLPPETYGDQRLLDGDLALRGAAFAVRDEVDRFGNRVHRATAPYVHASGRVHHGGAWSPYQRS